MNANKKNDLRSRLERLETTAGGIGSFERRIRATAIAWGEDPETFVKVTRDHEATLDAEIGNDGLVTWPTFCFIYDLLKAGARG